MGTKGGARKGIKRAPVKRRPRKAKPGTRGLSALEARLDGVPEAAQWMVLMIPYGRIRAAARVLSLPHLHSYQTRESAIIN